MRMLNQHIFSFLLFYFLILTSCHQVSCDGPANSSEELGTDEKFLLGNQKDTLKFIKNNSDTVFFFSNNFDDGYTLYKFDNGCPQSVKVEYKDRTYNDLYNNKISLYHTRTLNKNYGSEGELLNIGFNEKLYPLNATMAFPNHISDDSMKFNGVNFINYFKAINVTDTIYFKYYIGFLRIKYQNDIYVKLP